MSGVPAVPVYGHIRHLRDPATGREVEVIVVDSGLHHGGEGSHPAWLRIQSRWLLILAGLLVGGAAAAALAWNRPPVFEYRAVIQLGQAPGLETPEQTLQLAVTVHIPRIQAEAISGAWGDPGFLLDWQPTLAVPKGTSLLLLRSRGPVADEALQQRLLAALGQRIADSHAALVAPAEAVLRERLDSGTAGLKDIATRRSQLRSRFHALDQEQADLSQEPAPVAERQFIVQQRLLIGLPREREELLRAVSELDQAEAQLRARQAEAQDRLLALRPTIVEEPRRQLTPVDSGRPMTLLTGATAGALAALIIAVALPLRPLPRPMNAP